MRLNKIKLVNYIGIYNGLGLRELEINFYKAKHNICAIVGANGSGKSTLLKALNPMNESSYDFVPGEDAIKEISYLLNTGEILYITYESKAKSQTERKPTTCHVIKKKQDGSTVNLNPGGNMNEGKSRIYEELDIDSNFMLLAQLSSDDRGLADKTPAERKKFINSKISELDAFNAIYNKLVKKSSDLKILLNSLTSKIDNIGNIQQLKNTVNTLESSLGDLDDRKNLLLASIGRDNEKLSKLNEDGDIISNYNDLLSKKDTLSIILEDKKDIIGFILDKNYDKKYSLMIEKSKNLISNKKKEIDDLFLRKTDLSKDIQNRKIRLSTIGDMDTLESINIGIRNIESDLHNYINEFKSIGFVNYDAVTESEYETAIRYIQNINYSISSLRQDYSYGEIEIAFDKLDTSEIIDENIVENLRSNLQKSKDLLYKQLQLKESCKNFSAIPKDCKHMQDCPFVADMVSAKNELLTDDELKKLASLIDKQSIDIDEFIKDKEELSKRNDCKNKIKQILSNVPYGILKKFPNMEWIQSAKEFKNFILSANSISLDISKYLAYSNYITIIKSKKSELQSLLDQKKSIEQNKDIISILETDISNMEKQSFSIMDKVSSLQTDVSNEESKLIELENTYNHLVSIEQQKKMLSDYTGQLKEVVEKIPKLKADYEEAEELKKSISSNMDELENININLLPKMQEEIQSKKYQMVMYNEYIKEYDEYKSTYEKVEKIKYYSSPTTGIQTIFMEMFMNGILSISNDLLASFFNGEYVLHPFVINEKEFRMPCLGKGIMNDDISSMSTSQICMISMILSFALLRQTSSSFSIIKLDEIDGGLDTQNRIKFIDVLYKLMYTLHYDQCVMISHNSELGTGDTDVIILRNNDPNLKVDGNVIFQYQ